MHIGIGGLCALLFFSSHSLFGSGTKGEGEERKQDEGQGELFHKFSCGDLRE
jgi:hypothetical protein